LFRTLSFAVAVLTVLVMVQPAKAVIIFEDNFDRIPPANAVGGPTGFPSWEEIERDASDARIVSGQAALQDIRADGPPDAAITMRGLSTIGYEDLKLVYSWRGTGTDAGETQLLYVLWKRSADINFIEVAVHDLFPVAAFANVTFALGTQARNTTIDIRFAIDVTDFSDAARLDFVRLEGTLIPLNLPAPPADIIFAAALLGLAWWRRQSV
jgi:hypothetical protein